MEFPQVLIIEGIFVYVCVRAALSSYCIIFLGETLIHKRKIRPNGLIELLEISGVTPGVKVR